MDTAGRNGGGESSGDAKQREAIRLSDGSPILLCSGEVSQLCMKNFVLESNSTGKNAGSEELKGTVCITSYRIFFIDEETTTCHVHFQLQVVEKLVKQKNVLEFHCKDFRLIRLRMEPETKRSNEENEAAWKQAYYAFTAFVFPKAPTNVFAYKNKESHIGPDGQVLDGWSFYNARAELQRLGFPDAQVRITEANANYDVCPTYPKVLAVPAAVTDWDVVQAAQFRSKRRVPVISWRHPGNSALLLRSAQPLVGVTRSRCKEDEKILETVSGGWDASANTGGDKHIDASGVRTIMLAGVRIETPAALDRGSVDVALNHAQEARIGVNGVTSLVGAAAECYHDNSNSPTPQRSEGLKEGKTNKQLHIMDARPMMNAGANKIKGAGFEPVENYRNCQIDFLGIDNIHVMRRSMHRLRSLIVAPEDSSVSWLSELGATRWMEHIGSIIGSAVQIVSLLESERSDGWDRTCQLVSLTMLMLDPYYRTRRGFIILIEKEWLSFGHRFSDRSMIGANSDRKEFSPVFLQFLDAVWQIWQQFPEAFEFNTAFLEAIVEHTWSCRFGTFLGNCEKERLEMRHLPSLWSSMESVHYRFDNPYYMPDAHATLHPATAQRFIKFWSSLYLQHDSSVPAARLRCPKDTAVAMLLKRLHVAEPGQRKACGSFNISLSGTPRCTVEHQFNLENPETPSMARRTQLLDPLPTVDAAYLAGVDGLDYVYADSSSAEDETDYEDGPSDFSPMPSPQTSAKKSPHSRSPVGQPDRSKSNTEHLLLGDMRDSEGESDSATRAPLTLAPVKWMPDSAVSECSLCRRKFTAMRRKHHCRRCGHIFCHQCTQHTRIIPHVSLKPVRVCVRCFLDTPP